MRVALIHDYLTHFGGAERVLNALMDLYPNAPVYTLVYDKERMEKRFDESRLRTSWLQKIPGARRAHRYYPLALMPLAVEQFDLRQYDVVLSASHSFSKGVITAPGTLHITYCFTPTRYAWDDSHRYVREFSPRGMMRGLAPAALSYLRMWDYAAAQRADVYLTLSEYVARRIAKYYHRQARVIPPPVDVEAFSVRQDHDDYYLIVSRLVPYKRIELAIQVSEKMGRKLKIVGTGPEEELLRRQAGKWTEFLGFVADEKLPKLYQGARALLFPQEEDFGITPLEAAASGKPTVAFRAGGALETVREGETGVFFDQQSAESLIAALGELESRRWPAKVIREHALRYRRSAFMEAIDEVVQREWENKVLHWA